MTTEAEAHEIIELSVEECLELLATQPVGRVAVSSPGGAPHVVPVNYRMHGEAIVFRSDPGLKIELLRRGPVSFQVDWIDWHQRTGWSVLVQGVAAEVDDHGPEVQPWAAGPKLTWLRIMAASISGRPLLPADLDWATDARAYL